ncbi:ParA family protein [Streptomyces sp. NPDC053048]|uniref:ParA family protein n=1 Tax=Streptomyces sp. NPDC053048 TaxID=3365694 RepID=UPI0037D5112A
MAEVRVQFAQKGGVGKTLIGMNLAAVNAQAYGRDENGDAQVAVAVWDPQSDALWWANRMADQPFDVINIAHDMDAINDLKDWPYRYVYVDTPGFIPLKPEQVEAGMDPLSEEPLGDMLRAILDQATHVIVPMVTEPQSFNATWRTIELVLKPYGKDFTVVINNWPPAEGEVYVDDTRSFCADNGWEVANTVIRRYRVHTNASANGQVCTQYKANQVALQARADFLALANELSLHSTDRLQDELTKLRAQLAAKTPKQKQKAAKAGVTA